MEIEFENMILPKNIPNEMYIKSIKDNIGELIIDMFDITKKINISLVFQERLYYRVADESYLLKLWESYKSDDLKGFCFSFKESEFINHFHEMTLGIYKDMKIKHFAIYTDSDCVDIITYTDPIVQLH